MTCSSLPSWNWWESWGAQAALPAASSLGLANSGFPRSERGVGSSEAAVTLASEAGTAWPWVSLPDVVRPPCL